MSGSRAVGVATSIVLHSLAVVAVAMVIPRADRLPPLFIHLTETVAADEPVRGGSAGLAVASAPALRSVAATKPPARARAERASPPVPAVEPAPPREAALPRDVSPPREIPPPTPEPPPVVAAVPPALVAPPGVEEPLTSPPSNAGAGGNSRPSAAPPDRQTIGNGRAGNLVTDGQASERAAAGWNGRGHQDLALAIPGNGGAGGEQDGYVRYGRLLQRRIQQALRYPLEARRHALAGKVTLGLTVLPSGAITSVSVVESSSHSILDEAALAAVRALGPQPFPANVQPRRLTFELPVSFQLE